MVAISDLAGGYSVPTQPMMVEFTWTGSGESLVSLYICYGTTDPGDLSDKTELAELPLGWTTESIPTDSINVGFSMEYSGYVECTAFYFVLFEAFAVPIPDTGQFSNVTVSTSECPASTSCYNCKGFWQAGKGVGGKSIPRV